MTRLFPEQLGGEAFLFLGTFLDDLKEHIHTLEVAKKLCGPKPPSNPLARFMAPTPDEAMLLSPRTVLERQKTAMVLRLHHLNRRKSGTQSLLEAIRQAA